MHRLRKGDWKDPERVQGLVTSYRERYGTEFWDAFNRLVGDQSRTSVAEFGCGPGLLLVDVALKFQAQHIFGLDASEAMLKQAAVFLGEKFAETQFELKVVDFDTQEMPLTNESIDIAFSGFFLHEVNSPINLITEARSKLSSGGLFVVYDFVSGNKDAFIEIMTERGMPSDRAEARYPHMCRHSLEDIEGLFKEAGYASVESVQIDAIRAVVAGKNM
ncbi:MAG: class I SAM-dependent methyltransferase [Candidatus Thorarchaeota archaeon]